MVVKKADTDVRDEIVKHLEVNERSIAWLHRQTGIKYGTLYYCLIRKQFKLSESNLKKIYTVFDNK
jgi:hypothetical protein